MDTKETRKKLIVALGGTGKAAILCGVADPTVSLWIGRGFPFYRLDFIKRKKPTIYKKWLAEVQAQEASGSGVE